MTEEGAFAATELHLFCKEYGLTPAAALRDPDLAKNLEVFRGYMKAKQVAEDTAAAEAASLREGPNG